MTVKWSGEVRLTRNDLVPALLRPSMYTGEQGERTHEQYLADAVIAYLGARRG